MSTDREHPQDADLEDTGLGPADHADPSHHHSPHEGYEGEGLGPHDHAGHESTNPDALAGREGYEGEGLGPYDHARHLGDDEELED